MIPPNTLTLPFYIPRICGLLTDWPLYLANYILRRRKPAIYHLRDGLKLVDGTGTLAGTIAVVFIRREYGVLDNFKTIVDIGANMGCFTVYAAHVCPQAKILSYEPEAKNFGFLNQNITINSLEKRVAAFQMAVAGAAGRREISVGASPLHTLLQTNQEGPREGVNCTTLPEILSDHGMDTIDLLKVNCEGAEYEIFGNCPTACFARIKNIRLEYHDFDNEKRNGKSLSKLLVQQGYKIERFSRYRERDGLFSQSGFIWASRV